MSVPSALSYSTRMPLTRSLLSPAGWPVLILAQGYTNCGPRDIFVLRNYENKIYPPSWLHAVIFCIWFLSFPVVGFSSPWAWVRYAGHLMWCSWWTKWILDIVCRFRLLLLSEVKQTKAFEWIQVEFIIFGCISGSRCHRVVCTRSRINVLWFSPYQKESRNEDNG